MLSPQIFPRTLHFKQPATTSRGSYTERDVWYVVITDSQTGHYGVGECAPLPDLSCDAMPAERYQALLEQFAADINRADAAWYDQMRNYPSIVFGFETALRHLNAQQLRFHNTDFSRGSVGMPINGLVWMGSIEQMQSRIEEKLAQGFRCIKLKIGAQEFEREVELLAGIRQRFTPQALELRLDANGAFAVDEALDKLNLLARYHIHSIEQPIRQGAWSAMQKLCRMSPIPIAVDEELIGLNTLADKERMLREVRPQYVIIKPTLCGGLVQSEHLYTLAHTHCRGAWFTSALESNVGLNSIAQLANRCNPTMPQGLGTGQLFTDNCPSPLVIKGSALYYDPQISDPDLMAWLQSK